MWHQTIIQKSKFSKVLKKLSLITIPELQFLMYYINIPSARKISEWQLRVPSSKAYRPLCSVYYFLRLFGHKIQSQLFSPIRPSQAKYYLIWCHDGSHFDCGEIQGPKKYIDRYRLTDLLEIISNSFGQKPLTSGLTSNQLGSLNLELSVY